MVLTYLRRQQLMERICRPAFARRDKTTKSVVSRTREADFHWYQFHLCFFSLGECTSKLFLDKINSVFLGLNTTIDKLNFSSRDWKKQPTQRGTSDGERNQKLLKTAWKYYNQNRNIWKPKQITFSVSITATSTGIDYRITTSQEQLIQCFVTWI